MSGEILADGNSPMIMTVDQYNERVAYTWKLAIEAEQERIIKELEANEHIWRERVVLVALKALIKGETNE